MFVNYNKLVIIIILLISVFLLIYNYNSNNKLRLKNQELSDKLAKVESENTKLKETADYHYKVGRDELSRQAYNDARSHFNIIIEKYPLSPLVNNAKQEIEKIEILLNQIKEQEKIKEIQRQREEAQRQEEEKYRPKSSQEAVEEWKKIRNNVNAYEGNIVTWEVEVMYSKFEYGISDPLNQYFIYSLLGNGKGETYPDYKVVIKDDVWGKFKDILNKFPEPKEKDWLIVSGRVSYILNNGAIVLKPIRIKNEGYK